SRNACHRGARYARPFIDDNTPIETPASQGLKLRLSVVRMTSGSNCDTLYNPSGAFERNLHQSRKSRADASDPNNQCRLPGPRGLGNCVEKIARGTTVLFGIKRIKFESLRNFYNEPLVAQFPKLSQLLTDALQQCL